MTAWGAPLACFEGKLVKTIKQTNNSNPLEMVLKAKSKEGNIYSRKSRKIWLKKKKGESLWYLGQNHCLFLPSHLRDMETPLLTAAAKNTGFLLLQASSWRTFFPGGAGTQHFSFCLQLPVAEAVSWASVVGKWRLLSYYQATFVQQRLYLRCGLLRILGPQ